MTAIVRKPKPRPAEAVEQAELSSGYIGLTSLLDEQRAKAEAVTVDALTLRRWWRCQVRYETGKVRQYRAWLSGASAALQELEAAATRPYWLGDATYRFHLDTLRLLLKYGHVLVCPSHGVGGASIALGPEDYEGLSLRGLLHGEGSMAWGRWCAKCNEGPIATLADQLFKRWQG
jgi:hypothetical protein